MTGIPLAKEKPLPFSVLISFNVNIKTVTFLSVFMTVSDHFMTFFKQKRSLEHDERV